MDIKLAFVSYPHVLVHFQYQSSNELTNGWIKEKTKLDNEKDRIVIFYCILQIIKEMRSFSNEREVAINEDLLQSRNRDRSVQVKQGV